MTVIHATFMDIRDVRRTVDELAQMGVTAVEVQHLADVDPPLADPVLVTVAVDDGHAPVEHVVRHNGGAVVEVVED